MTGSSTDVKIPRGKRSYVFAGGVLIFLGLLGFGGMFVSFGLTDADPAEIVGGVGGVLAAFGVLVATYGLTRAE